MTVIRRSTYETRQARSEDSSDHAESKSHCAHNRRPAGPDRCRRHAFTRCNSHATRTGNRCQKGKWERVANATCCQEALGSDETRPPRNVGEEDNEKDNRQDNDKDNVNSARGDERCTSSPRTRNGRASTGRACVERTTERRQPHAISRNANDIVGARDRDTDRNVGTEYDDTISGTFISRTIIDLPHRSRAGNRDDSDHNAYDRTGDRHARHGRCDCSPDGCDRRVHHRSHGRNHRRNNGRAHNSSSNRSTHGRDNDATGNDRACDNNNDDNNDNDNDNDNCGANDDDRDNVTTVIGPTRRSRAANKRRTCCGRTCGAHR